MFNYVLDIPYLFPKLGVVMESSVSRNIIKVHGSRQSEEKDILAVEEPLEISLRYGSPPGLKTLAITMRTPGNDEELALGFLFTEGIIAHPSEVKSIEQSKDGCLVNDGNRIMVTLREHVVPNIQNTERNFYTTSSCGVCRKSFHQCHSGSETTAYFIFEAVNCSRPDRVIARQSN